MLVSEFALVRVEDAGRTLWLAFRDVAEVDGRPVRDREERLQRLFRTPPANALAQARAIAFASAQYNIGDVVRTVNMPTLALEFLEPAAQTRSRFRKAAEETVDGVRAWVVSFEERARPTRIQDNQGAERQDEGARVDRSRHGPDSEVRARCADPARPQRAHHHGLRA
ncbi:MAG: hypothetical protein MZW92_12240 [Comamonadaceae bacterium]|nr:hypothetical protein [Comamonadaceae bacterium]